MFALPALILPLVFGLAIHRLYQIPRRLASGELRPPARHRLPWSIAGVVAYLALLAYTAFLGASLVRMLFIGGGRWPAYFSLLGYVVAYPAVYIAAAWVFYHAVVPARPEGTEQGNPPAGA